MKKHDVKIQGHGFFRKTKVGLASGIVLGAALVFGANAVSADEATVGNTANVANVAAQAGNEAKPVEKPAEVTKIENTQTPSDKADADGTYNSQVKSIEATNVDEAANKVRYRVEFHDNHAIPKDGAVKFDVTGATQYPEASDLYIDKTKVGTIKTYPGKPANQEYANDLANTETLKEFKEKVKEASSETILGTTKAELKFNEEFAKMNKNRAVEFTLSNYNYHVYTGNFPTLYLKEGEKANVFEGDTDKKDFKNTLSLPSVNNKVLAAPTSKVHYPTQVLETKPSDVKYVTTAIYALAPAKSAKDLNLPIYLQGVGYNGTLSFRSVDGPLDDREVMSRNQTNGDAYYVKKGDVLTLKTQDPSKQLYDLEIPYKVGDIIEGSEVVTTKTAGSKDNRFTDSTLYAKNAETGVTRTPVKLKVVEVNKSGIRFEVQDDVKLENGTFSRFNFAIPANKFALRLADNWLDRFGEDNLKKLLAGKESRTRLGYKEGHGIDVTLERGGKTIADHKGYTVLDKNTNLTFGESTKGTVKVRYVDKNMKEIPGYPTETVLDNKPWYTSVTITPKTIKDYEYEYATAPLKTIAGSGEQVISLVYNKVVNQDVIPKPKVSEEEIPFNKVTKENPNLPEGQSRIIQEGKNGKKKTTTTYAVDPKTGKVTPNEPTVETTPPVDQITEIGKGKDKEGDLKITYIPDPESPVGTDTIVEEGRKPKYDVTGKEKDPGKPKVVKIGTKPKVNVEEIPFKEVIVENPSKSEGYRAVLKEGKIGKKTTTTTYSVDPKTGVVTPNEPTVSIVKAEDALIEVGTGKDFVGEIETRYVPDIELEFGKTKIVQNGTPEVKDVTGKKIKEGTPTIIHIGIKPKVEEEELDFKVVKRDNPELPKGQEKVVQEGEKGKKKTTTTYEVDPKTGKVTSKVTVDTKDPQDKIIEVGTKEEAKVVTPAPEAPKTPQAPAAPAPQVAKAELPNTGEKASSALMVAGLAMAAMTAGFVAKGRKEEN
jgi:surface protein G